MDTASFTLKSHASLTANDFRERPLWAGYYEPDDVDEIVRWTGFPEATVRAALDQIGWEDDYYFPLQLSAVESKWMRGKLYAATAILPDGTELDGYVGETKDYLAAFVGEKLRVLSTVSPELGDVLPLPIQVMNKVTGARWTLPAV